MYTENDYLVKLLKELQGSLVFPFHRCPWGMSTSAFFKNVSLRTVYVRINPQKLASNRSASSFLGLAIG
jgi:hypothetical protein